MWDDLLRRLARYDTVVLTVIDVAGFPFSIRSAPVVDEEDRVLRVAIPTYVGVVAGPAGLLGHFHDDRLWKQTNFLAYGTIAPEGDEWIFRPTRLIEGAGASNSPLPQLRFRTSATRYIRRHGIAWPAVPWKRLHALYREARRSVG